MRTTPEWITSLRPNEIFVFGSNLAGKHGKGAAKQAVKFGARRSKAVGMSGQTFAIPTKGFNLEVLGAAMIKAYVNDFLDFARSRPDLTFLVTPIGCGLAGYAPEQIAPMFSGSPTNVVLPKSFQQVIYPPLWGADLD